VIIAHVLSSFGVGGQERVALDLADVLHRRGHQVIAVSLAPPPEGPLADEFRAAGVEVIDVPKGPGTDLSLVPRLAWALGRRRVEVVHSHNPLPLIYGAPAARLCGAVAIHTKHGVNPGSRGHRLLRRQAARLVSAFVAVSTVTAQQAREQRDCDEAVLTVIPNGIRLEKFAPDPVARAAVRAELGIAADAIVVGMVGRVDEFKNQPLLLAAIAARLGPAVHVVFVGDGPTRAALDAGGRGAAAGRPGRRPRARTPDGRRAAAAGLRRLRAVVASRRACRWWCPRRWPPACRWWRPRSAGCRP
jgi:glycosyltransferase involved in cell wall biosynthesis